MDPWNVYRILLIAISLQSLGQICEYRYFLSIQETPTRPWRGTPKPTTAVLLADSRDTFTSPSFLRQDL
jgi:hypothetical protein